MNERELGQLHARVDALEDEIDKLRERSHRHAGQIQPALLLVNTVTNLSERVAKLERWRDRWALIIGIIIGVSMVAGYLIKEVSHGI